MMSYAGFWKRFAAVLLDFAVLLIPMIALNWAIPYVGSLLLAVFYYPVFESSSLQATPGKYWMGLKVLNEDGQTLSFPRAVARFCLKYVSSMLLMVGYLMQLFTAKRQTLHDLITNAVVINYTYTKTPDWIQIWIKQMRYILRMDEASPQEILVTPSARSSEEGTGSTEAAPSASSSSPAAVEAIEKLYELYKGGALTEDEFQSKKAELLKQV